MLPTKMCKEMGFSSYRRWPATQVVEDSQEALWQAMGLAECCKGEGSQPNTEVP